LLRRVVAEHSERISTFIALQFLFDRFWKAVKVRWLLLQVARSGAGMRCWQVVRAGSRQLTG
jgi:hypothetical protein